MGKFNVPEAGYEWLKEKLEKLSKRSIKLGGLKIVPTVIGYHFVGDKNNPKKVYEIVIPEREVKINGWEFIAVIDHSAETGNIIRNISEVSIPMKYITSNPICEHCNINRYRRDTFVVRNTETNEYKQVGRSCLKDFIGHASVAQYVSLADLYSQIGFMINYACEHDYEDGKINQYLPVEDYLACCYESYFKMGNVFVSKKEARETGKTSTSENGSDIFHNRKKYSEVSQRAYDYARKALSWAKSIPEDTTSEYLNNLRVISNLEYTEYRNAGFIASIIAGYNREHENNTTGYMSKYVGEIGERIATQVHVNKISSTFYGKMIEFHDEDNNILIWFTNSDNSTVEVGMKLVIGCRVKNHSQFRGIKQTIISHVKVK